MCAVVVDRWAQERERERGRGYFWLCLLSSLPDLPSTTDNVGSTVHCTLLYSTACTECTVQSLSPMYMYIYCINYKIIFSLRLECNHNLNFHPFHCSAPLGSKYFCGSLSSDSNWKYWQNKINCSYLLRMSLLLSKHFWPFWSCLQTRSNWQLTSWIALNYPKPLRQYNSMD